MRVESVEYEDGRIYVDLGSDTREYPYLPALLIHPRAVTLLSDVPVGTMHPFAYEVRGSLDLLVDLYREASKITSAVLFIPPERQFLLDKGISIGTEFVDGMPRMGLPLFDTYRDALAYLLRSEHGSPPRVFLENIYFSARVAVDLSSVRNLRLPPDALRVALDLNVDPTTIGVPDGVLLPASRVYVYPDLPIRVPTLDPILRERGVTELVVSRGSILTLADAEVLGTPYEPAVLRRASRSPGILQRSVSSLLHLFSRMLSRVVPRGADVLDYAYRTNSTEVLSAYAFLDAVIRIVAPLPTVLASTNVLTPLGREDFLTGWELYRRDPKAYKRLYADNPICSPALRGLESFLLALSSLPLELPRWLRSRAR